jgi:hypothetical protein
VFETVWVRKHSTVFDRDDVVAAVVPVRQPQYAVAGFAPRAATTE